MLSATFWAHFLKKIHYFDNRNDILLNFHISNNDKIIVNHWDNIVFQTESTYILEIRLSFVVGGQNGGHFFKDARILPLLLMKSAQF